MLVGLLLTLAGEATRHIRDRLKRGKCPHCGYPQRGLASSACPECGAPRNPAMTGVR
jgi:rubrerythrin